jgi:hypothetical protein
MVVIIFTPNRDSIIIRIFGLRENGRRMEKTL